MNGVKLKHLGFPLNRPGGVRVETHFALFNSKRQSESHSEYFRNLTGFGKSMAIDETCIWPFGQKKTGELECGHFEAIRLQLDLRIFLNDATLTDFN